MTCFVDNCKHIRRLLPFNCGITFHRFPKDEVRFRQWLEAIGNDRLNIKWSQHRFICSEHFQEDDFGKNTKLCILKNTAIPSIKLSRMVAPPSHTHHVEKKLVFEMTSVHSSSTDTASETSSDELLHVKPSTSYTRLSPLIFTSSDTGSEASPRNDKLKKMEKFSRKPYSASSHVMTDNLRKRTRASSSDVKKISSSTQRKKRRLKVEHSYSSRYPEELRKFAMTLHFYSARAYGYVSWKTFHLALPHPSVLRKWSSMIECDPGFSTTYFNALKHNVEEAHAKDKYIIIDPEGSLIKWEYNLQEKETLSTANKLKKSHMEWQKQRMKVSLAAQILSNSIADALTFLCEDLKLPQFQGCEATVKFVRTVDCMFDATNSRLPWASGFKSPLKLENEATWKPFLYDSTTYLLNCKNIEGINLWKTPKKTPFLGSRFAISANSIQGIFEDFVVTKYFLTDKCSQVI